MLPSVCNTLLLDLMKPDQVSVTLTSPTSVKVKWKEPIYLDDPVTQYAVWYTHDMNLPSLLWNQRYVNGWYIGDLIISLEKI